MPSGKAMAKAAKIIKTPVNEKSTKKVADSDDETSSSGSSSSGSGSDDDDDATSSSGSGSGSGSGSESDSDSEEEDLPQHVTAPTPSKKVNNNASDKPLRPSTKAVAAPGAPFVPPKGFEPLKADSEPKASKLLSQSKLAGKQIWYITAPASLPITSIKSVALKDVQKGKPVATINGKSYGFQKDEGPEKDNMKLLVPSREGGRYETSKRGIDQVLHLQQIVDLPELMTEERATIPAASKFVRQQPKGLRMRFKPIGFGDADTGKIGETDNEDSDVEMGDAPRVFKKHKVSADSDVETPKKSKKDKEKKKDKKEKKEKKEKKSKA